MAGIYVHIPFCKQKCSYCDFHFSTRFADYREEMIQAISAEMERNSGYLNGELIETVYFGGGTPSLLMKEELGQLLNQIRSVFELEVGTEITLEANPDDCTVSNLKDWKELGVNRLSVGIQSFKSSDLKWMNRAHNATEARESVSLAKSVGFENITVDLMYGLPELTMREWEAHVQSVIDMDVPHISAYCLTVESKTALNKWVKTGKIEVPGDEIQAEQFDRLVTLLETNGFKQYEISNFAKPGFESKHNANYWKGVSYLGVGPSAHSFNGTSRKWNVSNNARYLSGIHSNTEIAESEELSRKDQFNELVFMGLRTRDGVEISTLQAILPISEDFRRQQQTFVEAGWLLEKAGTLLLTKEGRLRADAIASALFVTD